MDIKEYINSGILDLYVLGSLSPEEQREVERNVSLYPEIKAELDAIETTLNAFAAKHAVPPGSGLKNKIWDAIQQSQEKQPAKVVYINRGSNMAKYLAAASIALFAVSTFFAVLFAYKYNDAALQIAILEKQNVQLSQQYADVNSLYQKTNYHINFVNNPGTMKVMMTGTPQHPGMMAMVYWNKESKKAMISIDTLPMNPTGMQYELWAIPAKGAPIPEGVFDANTKDMIAMKDVPEATMFAVTLEKQGGVNSPSMDQMYMAGKVSI